METLKKHLPFSGQDGLHELRKIAVRFEEKIYNAATSQVLPYFLGLFHRSWVELRLNVIALIVFFNFLVMRNKRVDHYVPIWFCSMSLKFTWSFFFFIILQSDYLRKISLKMLSMETKSQTTIANSVGNGNGNRPPDPGNISW